MDVMCIRVVYLHVNEKGTQMIFKAIEIFDNLRFFLCGVHFKVFKNIIE